MTTGRAKRVWSTGLRFDGSPECGSLWRDDAAHARAFPTGVSIVAVNSASFGERMVEFAKRFRCASCNAIFMRRRVETVPTEPRAGFDQFG